MEINGVTIQMLPAASGDCIYLEFPDSDFRMLIDEVMLKPIKST